MKAMVIETQGDAGKLAWLEVPLPDIGPHDLLVKVKAASVTLEEKTAIVRGVIDDLLPGLADGRLKHVVDKVFPLEKAVELQDYMRSNRQVGKIVLKVD
ncbi:hypothetical protein DSCA_54210 [Desulfosarcina alkanivorans]|jgi:NADPH:quinone reductase-like Zn-dependent oxidoreductase|uniref:Alcohol dehydrogenase-like C-terminal domain-containing protein n=1 Tax=Desulfosarcina alkanivorans TaxID=571177 RepID=A0A5K7YWM2_9BACT|nr:zinc-binding dehydrogenase [Desulfosarcina alkanivorans]BBO71491.1 hypothetical protein DSCA_54210 [Desulfosarcina alkanivorans]